MHNSLRFMVNSTFGLAGMLDIATEMGLEQRSSDFGETLHVWGVPEGFSGDPDRSSDASERNADFEEPSYALGRISAKDP